MKTPKPIFAYTGTINPESLKSIEQAGYVAIQVESMEGIRVIDPLPMASLDPIFRAAFDSIARSAPSSPVVEHFGRRVARVLGDTSANT